jgi:hypothetical protein
MIGVLLKWLGSGALDRILATVDRKVQSETDREKIKGEIIKEAYSNRGDYMRSGGFWLMVAFAVPLAFWWSAVLVYSVLWCHGCAYPQQWSIAALPEPLNDWAGLIIVSIFGVIGVTRFRG